MNIGAKAHGNWTVSTKQPQVTDLTVVLPVISEMYWASFQVARLSHNVTVSQCDHFVGYYMYLLFATSPGWLADFFFFFFFGGGGGGGGHSAPTPMYLQFSAVHWSLGRQGYFSVSNVALLILCVSVWSDNRPVSQVSQRTCTMHHSEQKCSPSRCDINAALGIWGRCIGDFVRLEYFHG